MEYTGYTGNTPERLLLDSGAFFLNYDPATDTPESATNKLLGATRGGGEFKAVPKTRKIEVDGIKGSAKGLTRIDEWEVAISAAVLEVTTNTIKIALGAADVDSSDANYDVITGRNYIVNSDYINNITWIGTLSGSNNPVIIQVYNALSTSGLTLKTKDKSEAEVQLQFVGHFDPDNSAPPYKVYYPKMTSDTTPPTVEISPSDASTGILVDADITFTFSEVIQSGLVNASNFIVMKADGTMVAGELSLSSDKKVVTLNPTTNLSAATQYIAMVTTNVKDLNGNKLAANAVSNFTTA